LSGGKRGKTTDGIGEWELITLLPVSERKTKELGGGGLEKWWGRNTQVGWKSEKRRESKNLP